MNTVSFIARRVAAAGQPTFSRLIIRIAIVAVALSVAVMIVATSLIAGFKREISEKIFGFWGHIHITKTVQGRPLVEYKPISSDQTFYPELEEVESVSYTSNAGRRYQSKGGVRQIQAFVLNPGIIKAKEEIEGIILKGVGADFDWGFLGRYIKEGKPLNQTDSTLSREILISRQTADRLRVGVGDQFTVYFVQKGEQLRRRFSISGIYKTGLEEYDQKFALVDMRVLQQLLGWSPDQVSGFEVLLDDLDDLEILAEYIYFEELPADLYAETIREKLPEIFEWLDLQDINEAVIIGLMLVVAVINMVTALLILILERTNMVGTLKALGSTNWTIRSIFLYYAAYIIGLGLLWGNGIGLALCFLQDRFGLIKLDEANYYLSEAPIFIAPSTLVLLNLGTLLLTLAFLILPSWLVTRIEPVKAIRFK